MISTKIKEATKEAHQTLEKAVVLQLKSIRSDQDYADVLKKFYAYFVVVEQAIAPFITSSTLPDRDQRRDSSYLKIDIEELGATVDELPTAVAPTIQTLAQAFGALYVLEGSIMGGPYIVQMLQKYGLSKGFNFFSGYGENSGQMWQAFASVFNAIPQNEADEQAMLLAADETFTRFNELFLAEAAV